jgi:hypothetical protein
VAAAKVAPWQARRRLNDDGVSEFFVGKRSPSDGLHAATREPRSGGLEGGAHRRSRFYSGMCFNREDALVRVRRIGRGCWRRCQGGAPWRRGTCCGVNGVGEQPEGATDSGVLIEEDDGRGTLVAWIR